MTINYPRNLEYIKYAYVLYPVMFITDIKYKNSHVSMRCAINEGPTNRFLYLVNDSELNPVFTDGVMKYNIDNCSSNWQYDCNEC